MKKNLLFALFLFCLNPVLADEQKETLIIKSGQEYVVPQGTRIISAQKIVFEDDSSLVLPSDTDYFLIKGADVVIGKAVRIVGRGANGEDAAPHAPEYSAEASDCNEAIDGITGPAGGNGQNGVNLDLSLVLRSFGSLEVDLRGGDGGEGAAGSNGQNADVDKRCDLVTGGDAGAGGPGGNAGNGGSLSYSFGGINGSALALKAREAIKVNVEAGEAGRGGDAGKPGIGAGGRWANRKSLSGNRTWVSGGNDGNASEKGPEGESGSNGTISFDLIEVAAVETVEKRDNPQSSLETRIEQLESTVKVLMERLDALEGHGQ